MRKFRQLMSDESDTPLTHNFRKVQSTRSRKIYVRKLKSHNKYYENITSLHSVKNYPKKESTDK